MKSKNVLKNIFATAKDIILRNKKKTILLMVIMVIVAGAALSAFCYSQSKLRALDERYAEALNDYNSAAKEYNETLDNYNDLIIKFKELGIHIPQLYEDRNEEMIYNFETFYNDGDYDLESITTRAVAIRENNEKIISEIRNTQIKQYNGLIDSYNDEVNKYNILVERYTGYQGITVSGSFVEKQKISSDNSSWNSVDGYFEEYDILGKEIEDIQTQYYSLCQNTYNDVIRDYNLVAEAYNNAIKQSSIDFIKDLPRKVLIKKESSIDEIREMGEEYLYDTIDAIFSDTELVAEDYLTVVQITNPSQSFVIERLNEVLDVTGTAAVTKEHDPNGLLNKEGGYTSCTYFTVKDIDISKVKGNDIIEKGTDAGGAVEVYETVEDALNRCDYLSQFDGTLLYSGSYVIVGTMVIRTSYILTNKQQADLTDRIIKNLTMVKQ